MEEKSIPTSKYFGMIAFKNKVVHTNMENLDRKAKTKKGRKPFAPKKSLHAKKKEINKGFDK